jgi:hypothetical protein
MTEEKIKLLDSVIEYSLSLAMEEGKSEEVQNIIQRIANYPDISGIRIISTNGIILRSSLEEEIGKRIINPEHLDFNDRDMKFYINKSNSIIQSYKPILNKPKCYKCHSSKEKYNGFLNVDINYRSTLSLLQKNQQIGIMIAIFSLAILTVIIIHLSDKLINEPISELESKMRKLQDGNLNVRVNINRNDELGQLAKSFNLMVTKLDEAQRKIEEMHAREIQRAQHLATIGEMAAGLAHEIKNPIAGIKGALEVIRDEMPEKNSHREIINEIIYQTSRIEEIIQNLLNYARPKEPEIIYADINECIHNSINLVKTQFGGKEIKISFSPSKEIKKAYFDPVQIQEVLVNILLNSIQAIPSKGIIEIKIERDSERNFFKIIISDNGIGIKKENLDKIFKPFFTTKHKGTGLGLSICKRIIEKHNGMIEVESKEGEGATFIIYLPLNKK